MLSCSQTQDSDEKPRLVPRYMGIDKRAEPMILEFVRLAQLNNIEFTKSISVGFTNIDRSDGGHRVVGTCFYRRKWREVEIDLKEWNETPELTKENLLYHELVHCLCSRGHDFGDGEEYESPQWDSLFGFLYRWPFNFKQAGRYPDKCPLSIMFPSVMPKKCMAKHREEYLKEMFQRCDPW